MSESEALLEGTVKSHWRPLVPLWIATALEVLFFPSIVRVCLHILGGRGDIGGEIGVYWLFCVVPGAVVFSLAAAVFYPRRVRARPKARRALSGVLWLVNLCLLAISVVAYIAIVGRFSD